MDGLYKVWARRSFKIRPAKVKIRIGKPFYVRDIVSPDIEQRTTNREQTYETVTAHLKQTIADMISDMRGETRKELAD
jgi:hypothetical protein